MVGPADGAEQPQQLAYSTVTTFLCNAIC